MIWKKLSGLVGATALALGGLLVAAVPAQAADSWMADRYCQTTQRCQSVSRTWGTPGTYPYQYTVHEHNSVESTRWPLTSATTSRSFQSQTGAVIVFIYTTGNLTGQSAACACIVYPCAV